MNRRTALKTMALAATAFGARTQAADAPDKKSILLYSGWATHNIGDIGHTPGTLRYFTEHLPDVAVTCWLRKTNADVTGMLQRRFPNVKFLETGNLKNTGEASTPEMQQAFDQCSLFVQNSGMHFNRFWQPPIGLLHACVARKKPFCLYGQSFDGFRPQDAEELPKMLSRAALIYTRDTVSLEFLRKAGVTPGVLEFGPDGCFGIDVRNDAAASAFMAKNGLEPRKFLAVIVRSDLIELRGAGDVKSQEIVRERADSWSSKYIEAIASFVRDARMKVALVPEVEKEIAFAKANVFDKLPDDVKSQVVLRETWWNSDEAVSLFAQAHALLALEPHSCIMALAHGTPAIHYASLAHGSKAWMFRDIGLSEWLLDIDQEPAANATRALERIRSNYDLAQRKVKRAMQFVNQRSAEMCSDIATVLRKT